MLGRNGSDARALDAVEGRVRLRERRSRRHVLLMAADVAIEAHLLAVRHVQGWPVLLVARGRLEVDNSRWDVEGGLLAPPLAVVHADASRLVDVAALHVGGGGRRSG